MMAAGAGGDGTGRRFLVVDVELLIDRNAAVAYAALMQDAFSLAETASGLGSAKREPGDRFDAELAVPLAVGRALVALGEVMVDRASANVMVRTAYEQSRMSEAKEERKRRREAQKASQRAAQHRREQRRLLVDQCKGVPRGNRTEVSADSLEDMLVDWWDYKKGEWKAGTEDFLESWRVVP